MAKLRSEKQELARLRGQAKSMPDRGGGGGGDKMKRDTSDARITVSSQVKGVFQKPRGRQMGNQQSCRGRGSKKACSI